MAPWQNMHNQASSLVDIMGSVRTSAVLQANLHLPSPKVTEGRGPYLFLHDGRKILDAAGGAAVACLGHGDTRVRNAVLDQMNKISYCSAFTYMTDPLEKLCSYLVDSTQGHMARALIFNSGSEAMEAAMKLARQYFLEKPSPEPARTRFIARHNSYHGTTLGSLSMGGHVARRAKFEPLLLDNIAHVSRCFAHRDQRDNENIDRYVSRLADELEEEFQRLGPETVCAFVAEPIVGAALGCVPAVPGYFAAMRAVCNKYGALLILDEVMCGMGRSGTLHAWEQEQVVPDIQTIGKCLGGGYQPIAGVLVNDRVVDQLTNGSGVFMHGHTYQGHPIACAAALEVQRIIQEEVLLDNVMTMGKLLSTQLRQMFASHPNVGDIRGRGLFWAVELVQDRVTQRPFPQEAKIAYEIAERGLREPYTIAVYPGCGTVDGVEGDHLILAPRYNATADEINEIVSRLHRLLTDFPFAGEWWV